MKKTTNIKTHVFSYFKNLNRERIAIFICIPLALVALSICAIMLIHSRKDIIDESVETAVITEKASEKHTYPSDSAFSLDFESIGNGECAVSGIGGFAEKNLKIPKSSPDGEIVVEIKNSAFEGCTDLESIVIPHTVKLIGSGAFKNCEDLIFIDVDINSEYFTSINGVLFSKNKTRLICYPSKKVGEKYYLNPNVKEIDDYAFQSANQIKYINYPNGTAEFEAISIGKGNDILHTLPITCNYSGGK